MVGEELKKKKRPLTRRQDNCNLKNIKWNRHVEENMFGEGEERHVERSMFRGGGGETCCSGDISSQTDFN